MSALRLEPLSTHDAEAYWRLYISGRSDLPSTSLTDHLDRYLALSPEEQRTHFAFLRGDAIVGTVRIEIGAAESPGANLYGFAMGPEHVSLTKDAIVRAVDAAFARGASSITSSFDERYEAAFAAAGFRRWFARMRMEAPIRTGPVESAVLLKPPEEPEVALLARLFMDVYEGHMEQAFGIHVGPEEEWRGYVTGIFKGDAGRYLPSASFVGLEGKRIVGALLATHWMGCPLVADLGVSKEWRRRGLGEALLRSSMNRLADLGEKRFALYTTLGNDPAISLYRRLGFEQAGAQTVTARLQM